MIENERARDIVCAWVVTQPLNEVSNISHFGALSDCSDWSTVRDTLFYALTFLGEYGYEDGEKGKTFTGTQWRAVSCSAPVSSRLGTTVFDLPPSPISER